MAVAPAFAVVSGAALGGAARAPRLPTSVPALAFRRRDPCFARNGLCTASLLDHYSSACPIDGFRSSSLDQVWRRSYACDDVVVLTGAVRAGGPGMRAGAASSREVTVPEGESDGLTSSDEPVQFQSDELEVRDRSP